MSARRILPVLFAVAATTATSTPSVAHSVFKSPPWLSIESPVNPYDPTTRGAALLVHAQFVEGNTQLADLSGTAEGLVDGKRRSIPLRFDSLPRLNTFGVRRQWPTDGTWMLRIALRTTTALVMLDAAGNATLTRVPTARSSGMPLPRAVAAREIDSALAEAAKR
jgi:hypothetical protein